MFVYSELFHQSSLQGTNWFGSLTLATLHSHHPPLLMVKRGAGLSRGGRGPSSCSRQRQAGSTSAHPASDGPGLQGSRVSLGDGTGRWVSSSLPVSSFFCWLTSPPGLSDWPQVIGQCTHWPSMPPLLPTRRGVWRTGPRLGVTSPERGGNRMDNDNRV